MSHGFYVPCHLTAREPSLHLTFPRWCISVSKCNYTVFGSWELTGAQYSHEVSFRAEMTGFKAGSHYVLYLGHLLFIQELMSFLIKRYFVVSLIKTSQVALEFKPLHF